MNAVLAGNCCPVVQESSHETVFYWLIFFQTWSFCASRYSHSTVQAKELKEDFIFFSIVRVGKGIRRDESHGWAGASRDRSTLKHASNQSEM